MRMECGSVSATTRLHRAAAWSEAASCAPCASGCIATASRRHRDGYAYDPAQAPKLLEEVGVTDLEVDLLTLPTPSVTRFAELVQQQYGDVGIEVQLKPSANIVQDFFIDAKAPLGTIPYVNRGITKLPGNFFPGSLANICTYDDPEMNALIDQLRSVSVDSDGGFRLWKEAQTYVAEQALVVHGLFTPQANAWNGDRLGGVAFRPDALGRPTLDFFTAYVRR